MEKLQDDLSDNYACFNFSAQLWTDNDTTPIEDSTIAWPTPFYDLATLVIYPQYVWSDGQMAFCRQMSFNPWNSVAEHEPLGIISRIRKVIYTQGAQQRHMYRKQSDDEPTLQDWLNYPNL